MENTHITKTFTFFLGMLLLAMPVARAHAVETLVFENDDTRPFTAKTLLINKDDRSGDVTLQFGTTLNEQVFWDNTASKFKITDDLDVQGTMSGAAVNAAGGNVTIDNTGAAIFNVNGNDVDFRISSDNQTNMFFIDASTDRVGIGTNTPETTLEVVGTASGTNLHASDEITASGSISIDGAFNQDGLTDCDGSNSKVIWDETTGKFTCGTDQNQVTDFTLTGDSGTNQTISHGNTLDITGADSIETTVGATDTLTIDITDDSVDFSELSDSLTVDADTTLTFGANSLIFDLTSTGVFDVRDNGTSVFYIAADGNIGIRHTSPSTALEVVGTVSGSALAASNLINCDTIDTDANGNLICGTDSGGDLSQSTADDRYVNQAGDTMTGDLVIGNNSTLSVSGAIITEGNLTINEDNGAADAVLSFGNDAAVETLIFSDTTNRFEFSDDVHTTDNLTASGTLSVEGAAIFQSTIQVGGGTYTFPDTAGGTSGRVLSTDGSGQLSWAEIGTGAIKAQQKQIQIALDTAAITTDGTNNEVNVYVGSETGATVNPHQYFRIESSNGTLQDVDIRIKVLLPKDFASFSNAGDLSFYYKTQVSGTTNNKLDIIVEDADGDDAFTASDGQNLSNTSWTEYTDEFDGGSFDPAKSEYIYITVKGYTNSSGGSQAGEIVLTYTAQ